MRLIVVSESIKHVRRDESYSSSVGPAMPAGVMHATPAEGITTLCGLELPEEWHVWPQLSFPRAFGPHCATCVYFDGLPEQELAPADVVTRR